jgi:hypothetical protein
MNCKPGDLAITVNPNGSDVGNRNSGRFVEVLKYVGEWEFVCGHIGVDTWLVRIIGGTPMVDNQGRPWTGEVHVQDKNLRPIRPGDISDEEVRDLYAPKVPEAA